MIIYEVRYCYEDFVDGNSFEDTLCYFRKYPSYEDLVKSNKFDDYLFSEDLHKLVDHGKLNITHTIDEYIEIRQVYVIENVCRL